MKKILKISLLVLFVLWLIPVLKNTWLYSNYHLFNNQLYKADNSNGTFTGRWEGIFDYMPCGMDTRQIMTLTIFNDSSGNIKNEFFGHRIMLDYSMVYSWASLLPYDKDYKETQTLDVHFIDNYFYYTENVATLNDSTEEITHYYIYKHSGNILYLEPRIKEDIDSLKGIQVDNSFFQEDDRISYWIFLDPRWVPEEYEDFFNFIWYQLL